MGSAQISPCAFVSKLNARRVDVCEFQVEN